MNNDIAAQCEQSFYEELYHYADGKRCLVRDKVSDHIYMRKTLDVYRIEVFQYLKAHTYVHIPRVQSFWQDGSRLVVIEELISGVSLDYILENDCPGWTGRVDILWQICDGLTFLHNASPQIIHRDLKPSNVMVTDDGVVKIIDYDAAKPLDDTQERDTILIGTRGSAAPEQYGFGKCDERTDIYGLGGIIRAMFPDDPQMLGIAGRAMRIDPAARYQTVQELCDDLPMTRSYSRESDDKNVVDDGSAEAQMSFLQRLCRIPGFRTHKPWRMVLAVLAYWMIGYVALTMTPSAPSAANPMLDTWLFRLTVLGAMLSCVDIVMDWTGIFSRFSLMQNRNAVLRFVGRCLTSFLAFVGWALLYALIAGVLGLS